jgi:hypothetical protein
VEKKEREGIKRISKKINGTNGTNGTNLVVERGKGSAVLVPFVPFVKKVVV